MPILFVILAALLPGVLSQGVTQSPENTVQACYENSVTFSDTAFGELDYPGLGSTSKACTCRAIPEGGGSSSLFLRVTVLRGIPNTPGASCDSKIQIFTPQRTYRLLCSYAVNTYFDLPLNNYKIMTFVQDRASMNLKFSVIGEANVTVRCRGDPLPSQPPPTAESTSSTERTSSATQSASPTISNPSSTTKAIGSTSVKPPPTSKSTSFTERTSPATQNSSPTSSNPSSTTKDTGSTSVKPPSTTKDTGSTSAKPLPTTKNTGSTSAEPPSTTENTGSSRAKSPSTTKNTDSTSAEPPSTTKNTGSSRAKSPSTAKNTDSTRTKPPSTTKKTGPTSAKPSRNTPTTTKSTPTQHPTPSSKCPIHGENKDKLIFNTVFDELFQKYFKVCTCKTAKVEHDLVWRKSQSNEVFSMQSEKYAESLLLEMLMERGE